MIREKIRFAKKSDLSRDFLAEKKEKTRYEALCINILHEVKALIEREEYDNALAQLLEIYESMYIRTSGECTYYNIQHISILQKMLIEQHYQSHHKKREIIDEVNYLIKIFEFD